MIDVDPTSPRFGKRMERGGQPVRRPNPNATPCHVCPKGTPEGTPGTDSELTEANWKTVVLYLRTRATQGRNLTEEESRDPLLARNFAIVDLAIRQQEAQQAAAALSTYIPKGSP